VNTAPAARLQTLHGIGPVLAQRICAYRTQHGVFLEADDLKKVKGIGPVTVERIRADICFSSR
jgi:competence protein ComEA